MMHHARNINASTARHSSPARAIILDTARGRTGVCRRCRGGRAQPVALVTGGGRTDVSARWAVHRVRWSCNNVRAQTTGCYGSAVQERIGCARAATFFVPRCMSAKGQKHHSYATKPRPSRSCNQPPAQRRREVLEQMKAATSDACGCDVYCLYNNPLLAAASGLDLKLGLAPQGYAYDTIE